MSEANARLDIAPVHRFAMGNTASYTGGVVGPQDGTESSGARKLLDLMMEAQQAAGFEQDNVWKAATGCIVQHFIMRTRIMFLQEPLVRRAVVVAWLVCLCCLTGTGSIELHAAEVDDLGAFALDEVPGARFNLGGFVGRRVERNVSNWLNVAPANNPGLTDMFARRDSGQPIDLVPWAGEFAGKFLISGVQALRMSDDPQLRVTLRSLVDRLIELQADDGYLGPWPKAERLRGHWDLWGHYHIMLGLMMWHDETDDRRAMTVAENIGTLVCDTFLDTDSRVFDAGSHEMNMAIIHGMARLYRETGQPRYLRMAEEVLADFERAGDYYRTGLAGVEFSRTPRPRWESLHCLQGLVELYRITGDASYRRALLHHWASIRRFDQRNTGGFSSGERATGNPYVNNAIETCCVVAWQAVMIDALKLTGDSTIADDLESATLNAMLGAQHPSGAWCTYDTPMTGGRQPSHVQIRFQARDDTPHLNCCSVNGPRGYGSISEWGVMQDGQGLAINYYGPMTVECQTGEGLPIAIHQQTTYPVDGTIHLEIEPEEAAEFTIALRIPRWSTDTQLAVNGRAVDGVAPGQYSRLRRTWQRGDRIELQLDLSVRYEAGDLEQFGKASFYRGPILLARDDRFGDLDDALEADTTKLGQARQVPVTDAIQPSADWHEPWLVVDLPTTGPQPMRLIDFASAGATTVQGQPISRYTTWLPAQPLRPPSPVAWQPADGERVAPGPIRFIWRRPPVADAASRQHRVQISDSPSFQNLLLETDERPGRWLTVGAEQTRQLAPGTTYYWRIVARNENGYRQSVAPYKSFQIDPDADPVAAGGLYGERLEDAMVTAATLAGTIEPEYGSLIEGRGWKPAPGPGGVDKGAVGVDGERGMIKYKVAVFPEEDYSLSIWFLVDRMQETRYGQIFSAWSAGMDDPLRLFVSGGRLSARIEAGKFFDTASVPVETEKWYHAACVKCRDKLTLFVDGKRVDTIDVPAWVVSSARNFALGGNPNYTGSPEFLAGRLAGLRFYAKALSDEEVKRLAEKR